MNNSSLGRVSPGKARADGTCCLGCFPSLVCSPCGAVRLDLPATLLHGGRAAYGIPRLRLPHRAQEHSAVHSPCPFVHVPQQVASCCVPQCRTRAGQVGYDCSMFVVPLLYSLLIFTFLAQESSLILCSLCPPLQSLFWHSSSALFTLKV